MRRRLAQALAAVVLAAVALEGGLRLAGYRTSPLLLVPPEAAEDFGEFHLETDPVVVFDAELFWRPNPAAWADMDANGFRGRAPGPSGERLMVAIGDSNTIGGLEAGEHWTADLQALLDRNSGEGPVRVLNAGGVGWSSLQGLRRFHQVLALRPVVVFFSFGAQEAQRVAHPDAEAAERAAWLQRLRGLRLAAPAAQGLWRALDLARTPDYRPRVSLDEHRRHLEELVDTARARGVTPILLTRPYVGAPFHRGHWMTWAGRYRKLTREVAQAKGVSCLDVFRGLGDMPQLFEGRSLYNRAGRHRMATLLLRHLKALGYVGSDHVYAPAVEPGQLEDTRPELGPGWWTVEEWPKRGRGRWTSREAVLFLERREEEDRLEVDLSLHSPRDQTTGRIEVNGRLVGLISGRNGPWHQSLDVSPIAQRELVVRLVTDAPFVPHQISRDVTDRRALGVFVHAVRLHVSAGAK